MLTVRIQTSQIHLHILKTVSEPLEGSVQVPLSRSGGAEWGEVGRGCDLRETVKEVRIGHQRISLVGVGRRKQPWDSTEL